jgi:hypothetical protein
VRSALGFITERLIRRLPPRRTVFKRAKDRNRRELSATPSGVEILAGNDSRWSLADARTTGYHP